MTDMVMKSFERFAAKSAFITLVSEISGGKKYHTLRKHIQSVSCLSFFYSRHRN